MPDCLWRHGVTSSHITKIAAELQRRIEGEVRFDDTSRVLYSTDASIYQIIPLGVVIPRHAGDIVETIRLAAEHRLPVLPRGSGTSLGGQTVGEAIVLDFTKYMNRVLELNVAERWARVQPGVILDQLNDWLKPHGLHFAPDVSTSNRASIGGMTGNNSSGAHSLLYGKTIDHVQALQVVLSDGSEATFRELSEGEWRAKEATGGLEGQIYREVARLAMEHRDEILARVPKLLRRVGGYNLDRFLPPEDQRQFEAGRIHRATDWRNLAKIVVGSEGTLCAVTEITVNLVPNPKHKALCVVHFHDLIEALEAVPLMLACEPAAIELTDRYILDLTRGNLALAAKRAFLDGDPEAIQAVEFYGDSLDEVRARLEHLKQALRRAGYGYSYVDAITAEEQARVWDVRKAGLGLLMGLKGDAKPIGFVEDTAVPPEHLAAYIRRFRQLLADRGVEASYYAHASVGCLHVRPMLNLKDRRDVEKMRDIAVAVSDLVAEYGGAMSAEHGDGLVRSEFTAKMYGPQLYAAFKAVKRAFDPQGIMNPGKIVDAPPMHTHLRYGEGYRTLPVKTYFDFRADGGMAGHVELCSGVGACRKLAGGTMCPSYRATREEAHSTRGRANMLRAAMSGLIGMEGLADRRVYDVLDLCLECKACKAECEANVDMARLKAEFLAHYYDKHGLPLSARLFGNIAPLSRIGCALAPLSHWALELPLNRLLLEKLAGIDRRRPLPRFARPTFPQWFARHTQVRSGDGRPAVVLLDDTFMKYNEPQIGIAAVRLLEAFGYRVIRAGLVCCGRPMISKGMLRQARRLAEQNVRRLLPLVEQGLPILGCEPSCVSALVDDYPALLATSEARRVAAQTFMLEHWLMQQARHPAQPSFTPLPQQVLLHGHCHQKALFGTGPTLALLRLLPSAEVSEIPSGCCGMAGSFGYERAHYELSRKIGELSVLTAARQAPADAVLVAPGTSCRHQIAHFAGRQARHPVELVASALIDTP
jgi:FAD/FMN-containing dehydrogenase/Fe-S oxidoreductase